MQNARDRAVQNAPQGTVKNAPRGTVQNAPHGTAPTSTAATPARADAPTTLADLLTRTGEVAAKAGRRDLVDRVTAARERVSDPRLRIVVVGPLKQGKSQFVNSLLGLDVCSVGDDETTAVPTMVAHGDERRAELVVAQPGGDPARIPIPFEDIHAVTPSDPRAEGRDVLRLEITVSSPLLADGLVIVDTPGVGGHGNPHASATLGLISSADAVLVLSDSSQEFTEPEVAFLRRAVDLCPAVACLITKTDLYPHWRRIVDVDREHLSREGVEVPLLPVSSLLRSHALRLQDTSLDEESGFPALYEFLRGVVRSAAVTTRKAVALDVTSVAEHVALALGSELAALRDPESAAAAVGGLQRARESADEMRRRSSRWQQTLADGIADLASDIDHDLRDRLRHITREAETAVDEGDPGKDWTRIGEWLQEQIADAVGDNFVWAHERSIYLAENVARHFAESGEGQLPAGDIAALAELDGIMDPVTSLSDLESGRMGITSKVLVGMRGSYGGVLMFGLVSTMMGFALLNPVSLGAGVLLGSKAYKDDKEQRVLKRRADAKQAIRKFTDDVAFQVGKESRDRLRAVQRVLRDHFTEVAEQTLRSVDDSLKAAQEAATLQTSERASRTAELERALSDVATLRRIARTLDPTDAPPADGKRGLPA
ncbi:dynamin family protein [Rhodococcus kroppenstedtii]|uniref:dynamin family protein n=1 Tax=Rhodococcoides kroppenstedtii TaxID=293050 RepID=UPI00295495A1|nr:dynamin family protein [Rhodococcus kroppenstedtii]MDV7198400.1 dynamin family protein [Rhodococcus kroppenstedtii]